MPIHQTEIVAPVSHTASGLDENSSFIVLNFRLSEGLKMCVFKGQYNLGHKFCTKKVCYELVKESLKILKSLTFKDF